MEMRINGIDAATLGVFMGDSFLDNLLAPVALKEPIENESALEHGETYYLTTNKASRDVTLQFAIVGESATDFNAKYSAFLNTLYAGDISLFLELTGETFKLVYRQSQTFNRYTASCKVSVKFKEYNPNDRG